MDFSSADPWLRTLAFAGLVGGAAVLCWWALTSLPAASRQLVVAGSALATVPAAVIAPFEGGEALSAAAILAIFGFLVAGAAALLPELRSTADRRDMAVVAASPGPRVTPLVSATRVSGASLATEVRAAPVAENTVGLGKRAAIAEIAFLVELSGDGHPHRLGPDTRIGRDATAEISLDGAGLSREHARVKLDDGRFVLYDLGSTNGTRLVRDGRRRKVGSPVPLRDLDTVELGEVRLAFIDVEVPPR